MFHLTIWTYLLLCAYVAVACAFTARRRRDLYWRTGWIVMALLVAAVAWLAWALVVPRLQAHALGDYTYESVGCLLACLTGLYGLVWTIRARALSGLLPLFGAAWLLMLYANLIAQA